MYMIYDDICIHTYIHACMHAYIHTNIHTYIHTYIYIYIHICIHIVQQPLVQVVMHETENGGIVAAQCDSVK